MSTATATATGALATLNTAIARQQARHGTRDARSIVLAQERHLDGTARHIGTNSIGGQLYQVRSQTSDAVYVVTVYPRINDVACCCTAGSYNRACVHAGAALLADRQRQACEGTDYRDAKWRSWLNGGEW
jgi:hypothetical protein